MSDDDSQREQEILNQANEIQKRREEEQYQIQKQKVNVIRKSWYDIEHNKLTEKLKACDSNFENMDDAVKKFKTEHTASLIKAKHTVEEEMNKLGPFTGQCLHKGGTRTRWTTYVSDSDGDSHEECNSCGVWI